MSNKHAKTLRFLARMKAIDAESAEALLNAHAEQQDGGPGSGNFGHKGRPGKKGGSAPRGGGAASGGTGSVKSSPSFSEPSSSYKISSPQNQKIGRREWPEDGPKKTFEYKGKQYSFNPTGELANPLREYNKNMEGYEYHGPDYGWEPVEENKREKVYRDPDGKEFKLSPEGKKMIQEWKKKHGEKPEIEKTEDPEANMMELEWHGPEGWVPVGQKVEYKHDPNSDPTGRKMTKYEKQVNQRILGKQADEVMDWCADNIGNPEYKDVRDVLIRYAGGVYADGIDKELPTPEESQKETEEKLGNISPQLQPYFREVYEKRLKAEPKITSDLCEIADSIGTGMYGLGYRLKSAGEKFDKKEGRNVCRAAEKIAEDMRDKGLSYEEAVNQFSDMVRYTQACTTDNIVDNFERTKAEMEKRGYKFIKVKNTWESFSPKKPYRGVNCVCEDKDGNRFELQFHTPESLVGKEMQHPWYEDFRTEGIDPKRKEELGRKMYENMKRLKAPKNIGRISNYPPDSYD